MATQDFLFELGTEELPPKALKGLSKALENEVVLGIKHLFDKDSATALESMRVDSFASPRRLAVRISDLAEQVPSSTFLMQGPPARIAFDADGNPTKALEGFAKKCGATVEQLEDIDGKMCMRQEVPAKPVAGALPDIVTHALSKLPIPKRMRWGATRTEFVRPVKWVMMLMGDQVIECEILGLPAGRTTQGHRFHHNAAIEITTPAEYEEKLLNIGKVVADFATRREQIRSQVESEGQRIGGIAQVDDDLLDEVTALNEWPVALTGGFEEAFLAVPAEALISSMKEHQKYFHVNDEKGNLMPFFITIANIASNDPQQVIKGNEKVIRPRLADAKFFFETDKKVTLESRVEKLKTIVFQNQLGTVYDKAARISALAGFIAEALEQDSAKASRAGLLSKADLLSDMVYEFTDLQGLMGYHYALADGEDAEVAKAIYEQYLPKYAGDDLPETNAGIAVALADRLDTLTGLFGINQPPTGSKDPFALRRAALGILRILVEKELSLDLEVLVEKAASLHSDLPAADTVVTQVTDFMLERFRAWYEDKGVAIDSYLAVNAVRPTRPLDFDQRVRAVNSFKELAASDALAAANKRVSNILAKNATESQADFDPSLLSEAAEKELADVLAQKETVVAPLFAAGKYDEALTELAALQASVDNFFDNVMVMADDEKVRANRISLLARLRALFLQVADISVLSN
ncbi:glycine--tRNA ligase subunit beta [Neptunomonas sp. XY-337]|uniref:glycine--tRNA ligase subunit beta n=1 Tax=Neptunomonas sp. XY-337 TaxID=2561897 RepID=UPI0010AA8562|nr:glycine--tRNA ligase subunit beta [Neptunomonas sp. XY-337]